MLAKNYYVRSSINFIWSQISDDYWRRALKGSFIMSTGLVVPEKSSTRFQCLQYLHVFSCSPGLSTLLNFYYQVLFDQLLFFHNPYAIRITTRKKNKKKTN